MPSSDLQRWARAGLHVLPGFITDAEMHELVAACRAIADEAPLRVPVMPSGDRFRCKVSGAGRAAFFSTRERGYHYTPTHPTTGRPWPTLPPVMLAIADRALVQTGEDPPETGFDSMLLNQYDATAERRESLGLHVDNSEPDRRSAIVLASIGADAEFIVGGAQRDDPEETIVLSNGTVLVMARAARYWYHGIKRTMPVMCSPIRHGVRLSCSLRSVFPERCPITRSR